MKDILKHFVIGLVIGLIISGLMVWSYNVGKRYCANNVDTITDTITVSDTITQWQPYDVHHYRTDTAYLPVIDTILDTVTDSVFVEVPMSMYHYDTTIADTTHTTRIQTDISGFNVSLEQLTTTTEITRQEPKNTLKWYTNICPAVGVGYGTGGFGFFLGVGYKIFN